MTIRGGSCSAVGDRRTDVLLLLLTSSSAIAERKYCRVDQFWSKVKDDIL